MVSQETLAECHTVGNSGVGTRGRYVTAYLHLRCSASQSVRIWNIRIGFAVCLTQTDFYQPDKKALTIAERAKRIIALTHLADQHL